MAPAVLGLALPAPRLVVEDGLDDPVVDATAVVDPTIELVLVTVTGILEPLVAGKAVNVVHKLAFPGHVPMRFKSLSSGPVGPFSYFHSILAFRKLTCRGSLSGYRWSPQPPRKCSHAVGKDASDGVKTPSDLEVGVNI